MPIHDLGYRNWTGERASLYFRWVVIARIGILLAFRSRLLKRLIYMAWIPAVYMAFVFFLLGQATQKGEGRIGAQELIAQQLGPDLAQMFSTNPAATRGFVWNFVFSNFMSNAQLWIALVVSGLVGASLLANDLKGKTFLLYYSKPITPTEYYIGKATVVVFYVAIVTLLPDLLLYILSVAFSPSLDVVGQTWDIPLKIFAGFASIVIPCTILVLFVSSMTQQARYAVFGWFAIVALGELFYNVLHVEVLASQQRTVNWASLLSLKAVLATCVHGVFGSKELFELASGVAAQDFSRALVFVGVVCLVALIVTRRRLLSPIRV